MLISLLLFSFSCVHLSCGYRAVYVAQESPRIHVKLTRSLVADPVAGDDVAAGVREELAREGALESGDGWPCAEVEVLRADQASEGIAAKSGVPVARGTDVGIVARAWITPSPGSGPLHDTGDMRAADLIAIDEKPGAAMTPDSRAAGFHQADALRAAARRLGHKLGRKLLGHPAASEAP